VSAEDRTYRELSAETRQRLQGHLLGAKAAAERIIARHPRTAVTTSAGIGGVLGWSGVFHRSRWPAWRKVVRVARRAAARL